jgi:porin
MCACALSLVSAPLLADAECSEDCGPYRAEGKYIHDTWHVARGGVARGTENIGKIDVALAVDGGRAFNVPGLTLFARAIHDDTGAVSAELTGDAQGVSNIEAMSATRLFELWSEWTVSANHSLRVGLYDLNSEFDANATGALFLNASHGIGKDVSQSGQAGPSIFPLSSFGARMRWSAAPGWSVQLAALDGVPGDPDNPKRTTVHLDGSEGALLALETSREGDRLSKLAFGTWYYTGRFDRLAASEALDTPSTSRGTGGAYTLAEVQLYRVADESGRGLAGFVRFGVADADVNRFASYLGTGLVYTGVATADDQLGIALARASNGNAYQREQALSGSAAERAETNLELTWRFNVRDWLAVQPDVQYILNPNTDPALDDAFALGLRFELSAGYP